MSALSRITYVDDDAGIRQLVELTLTVASDYELQTCASGQDALDETPDFRPDIILLDHNMPGMDGIETYQRLREIDSLKTTPVVFITGNQRDADMAAYRALGAAGYIAKPFDPITLPDEIETCWRESQREVVEI